jgi:tetratricopeptide (TPR) repeat protein
MTLDIDLAQLENAQLVRALREEELAYLFKHTLTQETAYESLLLKKRRLIHRQVAKSYEQLYPNKLDEYAPILARHYAEAGDEAKTLEFATRAGDAAWRIYANTEAVEYYSLAIKVAKARFLQADGSQSIKTPELIRLYTQRGRALELSNQYERALENYDELEALAETSGSREVELAALTLEATTYSVHTPLHDSEKAQSLSERGLRLAAALQDRKAEAKILWNLMLLHIYGGGDSRKGVEYGERSLAIARELGLREQLAYTLNDIFYAYTLIGDMARGRAAGEEARALWRELDNKPMLADSLNSAGFMDCLTGDYERALVSLHECYDLSQSIGNLWNQAGSCMLTGMVNLELGRLDIALPALEEAIRVGEKAGATGQMLGASCQLAWAYGLLGAADRGLEVARRLSEHATAHFALWRPWVLAVLARLDVLAGNLPAADEIVRTHLQGAAADQFAVSFPIGAAAVQLSQGELALAQKDHNRVIEVMEDFLVYLRRTGMRNFVADALYLKSQALLSMEPPRVGEALAVLHESRAAAEVLGARRNLWAILLTLSEVESERGNVTEADALRQSGRQVVDFIAEHIPSSDLRASFLKLPRVQALTKTGADRA